MKREIYDQVINDFETPCYVFDLDDLKDRVQLIKEKVGADINVCYAMKANPFLTGPMNSYIDRYEVCSPGEYEICIKNNIPADKLIISGVNKTYDTMERIFTTGGEKAVFTIESREHYDILSEMCRKHKQNIRVLIRLTSGNQFGVDKKEFFDILKNVISDDNISFFGVHFYSGTQKKVQKVIRELEELEAFGKEIRDTFGIETCELEYGPGLVVDYFDSDKAVDAVVQLEELRQAAAGITSFDHITFEMGRFIATCCGYYFTKVMDVKKNNDVNYCIVDGGIHQLNYYGQIMGMKRPHMDHLCDESGEEGLWNICGSLCTVNDVIVKGASFKEVRKGDHFVFKSCGAYSVTEGMALFLSRELPQVILYSEKDGFNVVRKHFGTNILNS